MQLKAPRPLRITGTTRFSALLWQTNANVTSTYANTASESLQKVEKSNQITNQLKT